MENNKILIGVQFTECDKAGKINHTNIELYVVRDITMRQLMEGIQYGLEKLSAPEYKDHSVYAHCSSIFQACHQEVQRNKNGMVIFSRITLTSFNASAVKKSFDKKGRFVFSPEDMDTPLCDLGFITSSRLIFDSSGKFPPQGMLETGNIIEAFDPVRAEKIFFPEYNISSRQLIQFDETPVEIIAPTDPPEKLKASLVGMLLPSLVSVGLMIIMRLAVNTVGKGSGVAMALMSGIMGVSALVTTIINWRKQKKDYADSLFKWRTQYEGYINSLLAKVKARQKRDVAQLEQLYPDMLTLIKPDSRGVYSMNDRLFSRAPQDKDFLSFRIGRSGQVPGTFEINAESKDEVFSEAFFDITPDYNGNDQVKLILRDEVSATAKENNLSALPSIIKERYQFLPNAPLLYSLKNKGALGVVDYNVTKLGSRSDYFVSRMIFELCYYHSPEDLQFIMFFDHNDNWNQIENTINQYKFMPHFRGLFSDKSQFVFDDESAHSVMSNLLTLMNDRAQQAEENGEEDENPKLIHPTPHIVMIVFDEHGLKEHAFAEYLPVPPEEGETYVNQLGLSFVYVVKYKEYLPHYCDDIVRLDGNELSLTPRNDANRVQKFDLSYMTDPSDAGDPYKNYLTHITFAFRFFSSIYYAKIAQNGKVPSMVSMEEIYRNGLTDIQNQIRAFWGIRGKSPIPHITESMSVPIGKTESGISTLDLHEKADGPHMLVAGTTGSGKTETIISYLLGLCMQYRPDELNLLLIDMKGGGFTKRLGHLPHVVGTVTDVDGDENGTGAEYMLSRFLDAVRSEIKRRKQLFNRMHVDNIDAYIQACENIEAHLQKKKIVHDEAEELRKCAVDEKLSHLILVVDEFTELKRFTNENSDVDYMGEITTIARIGRSLGFHIILISQNIEGAITDDIRVNSKARLCLKVATRQASKDMIGNDLAASPYMPGNGRAYLLVGTGSKFEYFQSAYSGAGVEGSVKIQLTLASKNGAYLDFYDSTKDNTQQKKRIEQQKREGVSKTQLEVISDAICSVYQEHKKLLAKPHTVFFSPLAECLYWDPAEEKIVELSKKEGR